MKIFAIQNNTNNNYNRVNKVITPSFKSNSVMEKSRRFVTGTYNVDKNSLHSFSTLIKSPDFKPFSDITAGKESFIGKVFENISNPFSGMVILSCFPMLDKDFLKENLFKFGLIHSGLAQLDYTDYETRQKLRQFYKFAANDLGFKDNEIEAHTAINEGLKQNNLEYLRVLMDERELTPQLPNGEMSVSVIINGKRHPNPQIRSLFDDNYLLRKTINRPILEAEDAPKVSEFYDGSNMFTMDVLKNMYSPKMSMEDLANDSLTVAKSKEEKYTPYGVQYAQAKFAPQVVSEFSKQVDKWIDDDENKFGEVQFRTLYNIITDKNFPSIKDKVYGVSGNKILHLLAQTYVNPNREEELNTAAYLIDLLDFNKYDLNALNDFGETAAKLAVDSENTGMIMALLANRNKIDFHKHGENSQSAYDAMAISENDDIVSLTEFMDIL